MIVELLRSLRLADIVDIMLVSILLYAVLVWLRRTASVTVLVGTPIVAAIYIAAESLGMYLTSRIFHGLFAVVSIGLIILFQDDLRRTLGRRVSWWWLGKKDDAVVNTADVDGLVEGLFALAAKRIGALVVLVGRESVTHHLEGGIVLHGRFSLPLLQSIFEPHSPGHDGAVVIENGLVKRFGVHLPLSRNFDAIGPRGTRHSAALGLAERCDAMVIVVSEDRNVARSVGIEGSNHAVSVEPRTAGQTDQTCVAVAEGLADEVFGVRAGVLRMGLVGLPTGNRRTDVGGSDRISQR
jgi:DNA integrity scanning protein DisA with diadenylate cyclase activity